MRPQEWPQHPGGDHSIQGWPQRSAGKVQVVALTASRDPIRGSNTMIVSSWGGEGWPPAARVPEYTPARAWWIKPRTFPSYWNSSPRSSSLSVTPSFLFLLKALLYKQQEIEYVPLNLLHHWERCRLSRILMDWLFFILNIIFFYICLVSGVWLMSTSASGSCHCFLEEQVGLLYRSLWYSGAGCRRRGLWVW